MNEPREYVFVFEDDEETLDMEGFRTQQSVKITARNLPAAIAKLAKFRHENQLGSDDQADYEQDIDNGNISVLTPINIED